jgi:hypothetical protein
VSCIRSLDYSLKNRLNLVGQPLGRDCYPDYLWGYAEAKVMSSRENWFDVG